jgi:hypothetical protein
MGLEAMSGTRRILRLCVLLGVVCTTHAALADSVAPKRAREPEARVLFERAVERLREGQFAEARDLLNQSLALVTNPGAAFNLAVAYRGTGESLRAAETLQELLAGHYGALERRQRLEVTALLRAVNAEIGTLEIRVSGAPGSQIRIDGRHVGDARDGEPFVSRVDPGERLVTASATDRVTAEQRVRVERGGTVRLKLSLHPTLEMRVGHLVLGTTNPNDTLEIVGIARAQGKLERDLPPGRYRVRRIGEGGSREAFVQVRPRTSVRYQFDAVAGSNMWQSPWLWASTAGVVAAAAIGAVVLLKRPHEDPVRDPEFGVVQALRTR